MALQNGRLGHDIQSKKYDRQLRIWGAHGQALLEQARICLLRCGPTGSETLKNLVLGGIAAFTVVDNAKVLLSMVPGTSGRHSNLPVSRCQARTYVQLELLSFPFPRNTY